MANDLVLCDSVQAIVDGFPENKRRIQDYLIEAGHILFDTPVGGILSGANGIFQTFTLMQGQKQYTKVVKYVTDLEKTRAETSVKLRQLDLESQHMELQYNVFDRMMSFQEIREANRHSIQKDVLTLYVDRSFQNAVDDITREYQRTRESLERYRYEAIRKISDYTNSTLAAIDKQTREIIRYEEMACAAYRNEVKVAKQRGIDRVDIANRVVMHIMNDSNLISDDRLKIFLDFIDSMTKPFISFQDYVILENRMGR